MFFFNSVKFILFGSFINFLTFYYKNVKCYHGTLAPLSEYDGSILASGGDAPCRYLYCSRLLLSLYWRISAYCFEYRTNTRKPASGREDIGLIILNSGL